MLQLTYVLLVCDSPYSFIIYVDHCENITSNLNKKADINCNWDSVFTVRFRTSPE
jgi:hypothetical protein